MHVARVALVLAPLLAGWIALALTPVGAQDDSGNFAISAYVCSEDPGRVGLASTPDPAKCREQGSVEVAVTTEEGQLIDTCITREGPPGEGSCHVQILVDSAIVTEDVTTLPLGYAPRDNPRHAPVYGEFSGTVFVNLPHDAAVAAPQPPSTLPHAGSGAAPLEPSRLLLSATLLAVAVLAAYGARRAASALHDSPKL